MSKNRWRVLNTSAVSKKGKGQRRYSRDEVEALIEKAARANGIDPATIRPSIDRLLVKPARKVAKSAAAIESERRQRQAELDRELETQRSKRLRKTETRKLELQRSLTHGLQTHAAASVFVDADGRESSFSNPDAPVTRLDLASVEKRQLRGLFGDIVDAAPTQPYT